MNGSCLTQYYCNCCGLCAIRNPFHLKYLSMEIQSSPLLSWVVNCFLYLSRSESYLIALPPLDFSFYKIIRFFEEGYWKLWCSELIFGNDNNKIAVVKKTGADQIEGSVFTFRSTVILYFTSPIQIRKVWNIPTSVRCLRTECWECG